MISNMLLIISIGLVIISYLFILINYFIYKKKLIEDYSGFDIAKEITDNYDSINIVSSSDVIFSEYDIKRNVIRMNSKNYDGKSIFDIAVGAILAGYSLVNQNNNNYFKFSFVVRRIGYLGFVSLIGVVLSSFISNIGDAKIGLVVFGILLVYQYMRYQISVLSNEFIRDSVKKNVYIDISKVLDSVISFNKISFVVMLILIIRLVVIIFGI